VGLWQIKAAALQHLRHQNRPLIAARASQPMNCARALPGRVPGARAGAGSRLACFPNLTADSTVVAKLLDAFWEVRGLRLHATSRAMAGHERALNGLAQARGVFDAEQRRRLVDIASHIKPSCRERVAIGRSTPTRMPALTAGCPSPQRERLSATTNAFRASPQPGSSTTRPQRSAAVQHLLTACVAGAHARHSPSPRRCAPHHPQPYPHPYAHPSPTPWQVYEVSQRLVQLQSVLGGKDDIDVIRMVVREPALLAADHGKLMRRLISMKASCRAVLADLPGCLAAWLRWGAAPGAAAARAPAAEPCWCLSHPGRAAWAGSKVAPAVLPCQSPPPPAPPLLLPKPSSPIPHVTRPRARRSRPRAPP
jgi:hypothetical protein